FKDTVAMWAKDAAGNDTALLQEFDSANAAAAGSLDEAATWLEKTLLPNSKGTYAIGADYFSKKLLYEEMVDTPLERLLAIGEANLEKDYTPFRKPPPTLYPPKSPRALI